MGAIVGDPARVPAALDQHLQPTIDLLATQCVPFVRYCVQRGGNGARQIALVFIAWCMATRITHLLRATPPSIALPRAARFDAVVWEALLLVLEPPPGAEGEGPARGGGASPTRTEIAAIRSWIAQTLHRVDGTLAPPVASSSNATPLPHAALRVWRAHLSRRAGGLGIPSAILQAFPAYVGSRLQVTNSVVSTLGAWNLERAQWGFLAKTAVALGSFRDLICHALENDTEDRVAAALATAKPQAALHHLAHRALQLRVADFVHRHPAAFGSKAAFLSTTSRYSTAWLAANPGVERNRLTDRQCHDGLLMLLGIGPALPPMCKFCNKQANPDEAHVSGCVNPAAGHKYLKYGMRRFATLMGAPCPTHEPLVSTLAAFQPRLPNLAARRLDLLINDVAVDITLTGKYLPTYVEVGHAATEAEKVKRQSYKRDYVVDDADIHILAFETHGALGESSQTLITSWLQSAPPGVRGWMRQSLSLACRQAHTSRLDQARFGRDAAVVNEDLAHVARFGRGTGNPGRERVRTHTATTSQASDLAGPASGP